MSNGAFDLVLFGYRNDLARERVLDYLAGLPFNANGPSLIDRSTPTPQRLFTDLSESEARLLHHELARLGAQVGLVPQHQARGPIAAVPAPRRGAALAAAIVLCAGVVVFRWSRSPTAAGNPQAVASMPLPAWHAPAALQAIQATTDTPDDGQTEALQLNAEGVALANRGQFDEAAARLRRARQLAPEQAVVRQNLQTILLNGALHELDGGNLLIAQQRLQEALNLGERADLRQASGVVRLREGDLDGARSDLERVTDGGSKDPNAFLALGEVYLQQHDRPHALATLQHAREVGARGPQLDSLLDRLSREVDAEWDYAAIENTHFRVTFADGENRAAAQLVLDGLEDARSVVGAKFGYTPDHSTEVVLYGAQDFHAITQTPVWAGAAYDGRIKVPVRGLTGEDPALPRLLRHEYMHSLVADLSDNRCPVWLNEGLAVWAEEDQDGERRAWAEDAVRGATLFRLQDIAGPLTKLAPAQAQVAYAQSYLAVRDLIDRYGARRIQQFVVELSRQPLPAAFAAVYAFELADFEARWLQSLRS